MLEQIFDPKNVADIPQFGRSNIKTNNKKKKCLYRLVEYRIL